MVRFSATAPVVCAFFLIIDRHTAMALIKKQKYMILIIINRSKKKIHGLQKVAYQTIKYIHTCGPCNYCHNQLLSSGFRRSRETDSYTIEYIHMEHKQICIYCNHPCHHSHHHQHFHNTLDAHNHRSIPSIYSSPPQLQVLQHPVKQLST